MNLYLAIRAHGEMCKIMDWYDDNVSPEHAQDFYKEFRKATQKAVEKPFLYSDRGQGYRRINLRRFPYHILYRVKNDQVEVASVRHNARHPNFGMRRH